MVEYCVVQYDLNGLRICAISGIGKNKNTWDFSHSRSRAYYHRAKLQQNDDKHVYKVKTVF